MVEDVNVCNLFSALPNHTSVYAHHYHYHATQGGDMKEKNWNIRTSKYGFYFIEPQPNKDAKSFASELLGLEGVEEVQITSGSVGYIVAARKEGSNALEHFIKKNALKSRYVESHYIMSKR